MKYKGVTIGDKFIANENRKSKRVSKVIDFLETRSMMTNEIISTEVIYETKVLEQMVKGKCSALTVVRNRIK